MTISLGGNGIFGTAVAVVSAFLLWTLADSEANPADLAFPRVLLVAMIGLGLYLTVRDALSGEGRSAASIASRSRSLMAFALALAFPLLANQIGFYAATFLQLFVVPLIFLRGGVEDGVSDSLFRRVAGGLLFAAGLTAFLYVSFTLFLKFSMPAGSLL